MRESSRKLLDKKVEDFIKTIDEGDIVEDKGTENVIGLRGYYLLPEELPVHELYLDELRYFSKSLIDSALQTHTNAKTSDFSAYWAWTAALVSELSTSQDDYKYQDILRDYYYLIHSVLISERHSLLIQENHQLHMTISTVNPSIMGMTGSGLPVAATLGFSILEGLLKRRCQTLSPGKQVNILEGFRELVDDTNVSAVTKEVLNEVDDLDRYNRETLQRKMAGVPDLTKKDSLLWLTKEQRNYNIHGEGSTQAIGSVVLSLCSLVLLDDISDEAYQNAREEILGHIERGKKAPFVHPQSPAAFYPVETT